MALPSTIAIDGPAGSGKSSVSFALAQRLGYLFVDTGAFYRAVTLLALRAGQDLSDSDGVAALARRASLDITGDLGSDGRQCTVLANGEDVTWEIHSPAVDAHVSVVAANSGVRQAMLAAQRALAARGRVIMAGRDIGTVVLPDADLKIYIDASLERRAERRYAQRVGNGEPADLAQIREGLRQRDTIDSQRDVAPLLRAPDAIYLDTTALSLEQTVEAAYQIVCDRDRRHPAPASEPAGQP
ncbi:MAG: (d)CMP kinase [Anaerolineae bacterium]|nr:(d)CMP kinase [Anaerolineae bacterium]